MVSGEKEKEQVQPNPCKVGRQKPELAVDRMQKLRESGRTPGQKKKTTTARAASLKRMETGSIFNNLLF